MKKLRFALPKGSLNDKGRGDTEGLLKSAGFEIRDYTSSSRTYKPVIANDPEIECIVDRPQNMPAELRDKVVDLGILGSDIAREWELAGVNLVKLSDLKYGDADLVLAAPLKMSQAEFYAKLGEGEMMRFATEYPLITQDWIIGLALYRYRFNDRKPMIFGKYGTKGDNDKMRIIESYGATESAIIRGSADFVVETSASGKTLAENGLKSIETLLESSAGLYTTEDVLKDPWKAEKISFVKALLEGVVKARKTDYVVFNVLVEMEKQMIEYLKAQQLFAKEPTIVRGSNYLVISIEVEKQRWLSVFKGLKENGAEDIIRSSPEQVIS